MRTTAMIVIAAVAGFAIAWLLLTRTSPPPVTAAHAPAPRASVPAPAVAPPPVAASAPPVAAPSPPPAPVETSPPPAPAPVDTPKSKETVAAEPVSPSAEAPAEPPADAEEVPSDEESGVPTIDPDHAADLLADVIARQEAESTDEGEPDGGAQAWNKFDQEEADQAWSEPTTQQIEAALDQWLNGLPEEIGEHIAVVHVECRTTLCQILAADNDVDSQNVRAQAGQEWQQAIASLPSQPWWNELGFVDFVTQVTTGDHHTLYISYLRREVKPPQG